MAEPMGEIAHDAQRSRDPVPVSAMMLRQTLRTVAALGSSLRGAYGRRRLAPLYAPDPDNLQVSPHVAAAMEWLKRAQDVGVDRGVSYGVRFGADFQASYPETTGYICRTFVERAHADDDCTLLDRAVEMGHWESDIQLPEGAVMGGTVDRHPTPAIFNTGMVMLGWTALIATVGNERFRRSCARAANWLLSMQEADGNWVRGNSMFAASGATTYNVKAAWALCEAGEVLAQPKYVRAAIRNAEFCLSRQQPNGMFRDCCLTEPARPLLHTVAYTMQGLIGIGTRTGRRDFIDAAKRTADAYLRGMAADGYIAGRHDAAFAPAANWCCLAGSAQTSVVWGELFRLTGEEPYRAAMCRVNRYLMARHDIRNPDARLRGGLPGSWPTWGDYGRLQVLNWATKFLVDALSLEQSLAPGGVAA